MAEIKIEDGKIKIPYNFNNEKYIVGIENKNTNEIKVSKTIIPIKDAKPSYSLDITPKNKGSFNLKKNKKGEYEYVNTQIVYNINFIVNDIDVPSADIGISTDWGAKYILNKNVNPFEFILELNEENNANNNITTSDPQYDLLENNGNFVDEINIDIEYHDIIYRTKIKVTFQKSYFETISLYDSIDIPSRTATTEVKKGVITIDGYYNDDKVNKEDLALTLDTSNSGFTSIASTMGYMDIVKEKNDWFLTHKEINSDDYAKTPLYNYYVDTNRDIYEDGEMVVSGNTLYDKKNGRKVLDSSGNAYFNNHTIMIDNSGNTIIGDYISIDHSGNTKYIVNGKTLINNTSNTIYTSGGTKIIDLNNYLLTASGRTCLVDVTGNTVYQGTSINSNYIILYKDKNKNIWKIPLSGNSYYNFESQEWWVDDELLYSNKGKILYFSGNTNNNKNNNYIDIINNEYYVGGGKIIDSSGTVSHIRGFGYNIKTGVISDSGGTVLVTAITNNNSGTTISKTTGYTFNSGCTSDYGYYIGDINGTLYYKNGNKLLDANTIYDQDQTELVKFTKDGGFRLHLYDDNWIKLNSSYYATGNGTVTGYTKADDTTVTFICSSNTISNFNNYYVEKNNSYCNKKNEDEWVFKKENNVVTYRLKNNKNFVLTSTTISLGENFSYNRKVSTIYGALSYGDNEFARIFGTSSFTETTYYLHLNNNYYYLPNNKLIQCDSTTKVDTKPQADITATTIGMNSVSESTYISGGSIIYKSITLLNCGSGNTIVNSYLTTNFIYEYESKKLKYGSWYIADFYEKYIYKSSGVKVLSLTDNNIINNRGQELVSSALTVKLESGHTYGLNNKVITGTTVSGTTIYYDLNSDTGVTISGTVLGGMGIKSLSYNKVNKDTSVTTCRDDKNNIFEINSNNTTGSTINLNLSGLTGNYGNSKYKLTATTSNDKVRIITSITISANNHEYTWDANDKYINVGIEKDKYEKLTNNNKDRLFYYCNKDGEILYNGKNINYVIDEKGEYWDLTNGKKIIIEDTDNKKNKIYINLKNKKAVPPRNKIKDKYGNIKINKGKSYNSSNKTYRDKNNRIINETVSGSSQYSINEIYCTTAVSLNDGIIYDSNGRALMEVELNNSTVFIEGGLKLVKNGNSMNILSGTTNYVTGITSGSIGVTDSGKENNITITNNTCYYKGKKLYDKTKGAYYFEEAITGTTNTGFTLQNGLIVCPLNNNITGYTSGVTIKSGSTILVTISKNNKKSIEDKDYTYNIENNFRQNFIDKDGILLYKNIIIADVNNGIIYNMREPSDLSNIPDTSFIAESDTDIIIDETGNDDDYELEDKNNVYYDAHHISEIKKYIPDLSSYIFKCNNSGGHKLNVKTSYMGVMEDEKEYYIVDGGKNNSSYKIKVEPQFITQNMINKRSTIKAYIVNNNGDQIPHSTYTGNGYNFKYTTDASNSETGITADTFIYTLSTATPIFNEIKFSLHCNNDLVNQEIVEVLGENKLIKLTEYVDVTNGSKTYVIQPTANTYYGTRIDWKNNRNHIITSLTMSSSSTIQVISGYCDDVLVYEQTVLPLKKGEQGISGATGNPGPRGKLLYPAGVWDSRKTYDGTDTGKTPFVMYKDKYWVLTATTAVTGVEPFKNSTAWTEMEQYEAIYTKLLVAENGLVGGSVYNGDYVFSKNGINNNIDSNEYQNFNKDNVDKVFTPVTDYKEEVTESGVIISAIIEEPEGFIPNYLVDFSMGRAWFGSGKTKINEEGVIYSQDIVNIVDPFIIPLNKTDRKWDYTNKQITIVSGNTNIPISECSIKIIDSLNSFVSDEFSACGIKYNQVITFILDKNITIPNIWYKGEFYIRKSCTPKIIDLRHYTNVFGGAIPLYATSYDIKTTVNKIEFLFMWDGKIGKKEFSNSYNSYSDTKEYKTGKIILLNEDEINKFSYNEHAYVIGTGSSYTDLIEEQ